MKRKIADIHLGSGYDKTPENLIKMRDLLNETGPGFCLAKWTQVTTHLGQGTTHSCHHPGVHKIPLEEIKNNPSALHNTKLKKELRKEMLSGGRPAECDYCWRIEDGTGSISDRTTKSIDSYSITEFDKIVEMTGDEDVYPRYVEISFSNTCNLKCSYCGSGFSSKWAEEVRQHGEYVFPKGHSHGASRHEVIKNREENPYVEVFWKWFPEALPHMHTFRITGGEPLLDKNTFRVMKYLIDNPNPDLQFAINTNGCPPDKLWNEFCRLAKILTENNCVKGFEVYTSAESYGKQNDYSRYGMDWELFNYNIRYFLDNVPKANLLFMAAFNIFSVPTFKKFLEYVLALKKEYSTSPMKRRLRETYNIFMDDKETENTIKIHIDVPYVRNPKFLDAYITTPALLEKYLYPALDFITSHQRTDIAAGFQPHETMKFERIFKDILNHITMNEDGTTDRDYIRQHRANFYLFIKQYDERRNVDFLSTFPEMKDFYHICKLEHDKFYNESG